MRRLDQDRPLCLTCEREFSADRVPFAFVLRHAARDDAKRTLLNMVCWDCATPPGLQQRVLDFYRTSLIGEFRVLGSPAAGLATRH